MWIRINDFIINLDNVTNVNIGKNTVYISFNHAMTQLGQQDTHDNVYWNSLAFKREEISKNIWDFLDRLPTEDENRPPGPRVV